MDNSANVILLVRVMLGLVAVQSVFLVIFTVGRKSQQIESDTTGIGQKVTDLQARINGEKGISARLHDLSEKVNALPISLRNYFVQVELDAEHETAATAEHSRLWKAIQEIETQLRANGYVKQADADRRFRELENMIRRASRDPMN